MGANPRSGKKGISLPAGVAAGIAAAFAVTLAGAAIVAWLIDGERISEEAMGYGALAVLLLSAGAGAWFASALVGHQRLLVCALTGIGYLLILLSMTALFFGGQYQGVWVTTLVVLAGCLGVSLVGLKRAGGPKHRRRHITSR